MNADQLDVRTRDDGVTSRTAADYVFFLEKQTTEWNCDVTIALLLTESKTAAILRHKQCKIYPKHFSGFHFPQILLVVVFLDHCNQNDVEVGELNKNTQANSNYTYMMYVCCAVMISWLLTGATENEVDAISG